MTSPRDALIGIILDDLVASFGWERCAPLAFALKCVCAETARKFADQMIELNADIGRNGALGRPSRRFLQAHYVRALEVDGAAHVPTRGPALFLANHPGLADTLSLFAAIGRKDLKVVGLQRPFLGALPNLARHLIFTDSNLGRRTMAAQAIADHLAVGGAVLTFPAGCIEPDPDLGDALDAVARWPDMTRLIARFVPATRVVPIVVRGVACPLTARHWLTRLKRAPADRDKLAAALQFIAMVARDARPTAVSVRIGATLGADAQGIEGLHARLIAAMRRLVIEGDRSRAHTTLAGAADRRLDWAAIKERVPVR